MPGDKPVATMWESKITYLKGEAMQYDLSTTGGDLRILLMKKMK